MNHRRTAHACIAGATLCFAAGLYAALHTAWLCIFGFYAAALFAWCAARLDADHRRILGERDWAWRRALGEQPPPLDPCCRLGRTSHGAAHDHRCTDLTTRQHDDPRSAA